MKLPLVRDTFKDKWPRVLETDWIIYTGLTLPDSLHIRTDGGEIIATLSGGYLKIDPGYAFDIAGDKNKPLYFASVAKDVMVQLVRMYPGKFTPDMAETAFMFIVRQLSSNTIKAGLFILWNKVRDWFLGLFNRK